MSDFPATDTRAPLEVDLSYTDLPARITLHDGSTILIDGIGTITMPGSTARLLIDLTPTIKVSVDTEFGTVDIYGGPVAPIHTVFETPDN